MDLRMKLKISKGCKMEKLADFLSLALLVGVIACALNSNTLIRNPAPISPEIFKAQYSGYKPTSYELNYIYKESLENQ